MYAIIQNSGKQYKVFEGLKLRVDKIEFPVGKKFEINNILMFVNKNDTIIGFPYVSNVFIKAKILFHGRDKKIKIIKFNRRKHYRKFKGHRQYFTDIKILSIVLC
ncbi:50S ribosomal protein L21 [Candidatus Purcelliella pentastirinorum]|uniref:Large ribosomal subunit protein bL21 n=1 Tax=Candidatus Purcelliella pentastirinorum TaxID=472834 RepID=A0AAX3N837_9ENTR|nr:50S ribosomal protein L21 [Candidatus Purcelliella pentastirinorum]WDI78737.1 50S ribosomal protein L21 [Candidatus Purcelliella pentastirinorum]WDR80652.1 50S ribosomal protein L21 [Candidatus Purcelliella pentastirinorum]